MPGGVCRSFSPVGYSGFVEDATHMVVHRSAADDKFIGNLPVRLPSSDEPQHFHLSLAQTIGVCRSFSWHLTGHSATNTATSVPLKEWYEASRREPTLRVESARTSGLSGMEAGLKGETDTG